MNGDVYDKVYMAEHTLHVFNKIVKEFAALGIEVKEVVQPTGHYEIQIIHSENTFCWAKSVPALARYHSNFMDGYKAALKEAHNDQSKGR